MAGNKKGIIVITMCVMMAVTALGGCLEANKPAENKPPVARISSPATGSTFDTGVTIDFDGNASRDPEKKPLTFAWSFGDNTTGAGNTTKHWYSLPGKYSVELEVSDGKKKTKDRIELTIKQANRAPVVKLSTSKMNASNEDTLEFNATATTDADNDTLTFSWNFGDNVTAQGPFVTHLYPKVGTYNVTLNASDGKAWSAAAITISIYQANRPPVPALSATPLVAFINQSISFNASGSSDADNDTLTAVWDFGDNTSGTGLIATHSYSRIGNFTATATLSDGKLSGTANVIVTVVPRASIILDWNQTDYGYIVRLDADAELSNLTATVSNSLGTTDPAPNITAASKRDFRLKTKIVPVKGLVLNLTVRYWGIAIGSRTLTIYENTAMPGRNCTVGMLASTSEHTSTNDTEGVSEEWFNVSGSVNIVVRDEAGNYSMLFSNAKGEQYAKDSNNITTKGTNDISGWFNMTFVWGAQVSKSLDMTSAGNSTTLDPDGMVMSKVSAEGVQRTFDHNATYMSQQMTLQQSPVNYSMRVETLGIENKANKIGVIYSCLKLRSNISVDAVFEMTPGDIMHLKQFNETVMWNVRDDRYENATIYIEYVQNTYIVNDTSGVWTLDISHSDSDKRYVDDNDDGKFNPDPAPVSMDDMFTFNGPIPRELVTGDRITGTNAHGVKLVLEVKEESVREVDGVNYTLVRVVGVYSTQSGNVTGSQENWVVSQADMTGLPVESKENKTWKESDEKTTVTTSSFKAVTVRQD